MSPLNVVVNGALGKMGQQVLSAVSEDPGMNPVGGIDLAAKDSSLCRKAQCWDHDSSKLRNWRGGNEPYIENSGTIF